MKKIIIGNWKLNLDHLEAIQLLQKLNYTIEEGKEEKIDIVVSPSIHLYVPFKQLLIQIN